MLTVNHTIVDNGYTIENVFTAKAVSYHSGEMRVVGKNTPEPFFGVRITMPDNSESLHRRVEFGSPDLYERIYVMNDQGKTVATYTL